VCHLPEHTRRAAADALHDLFSECHRRGLEETAKQVAMLIAFLGSENVKPRSGTDEATPRAPHAATQDKEMS
jgi:hypothetical protein